MAAAGAFVANLLASLALVGSLPYAGGSAFGAAIGRAADALRIADLGHVGLAMAASFAVTVNAALLVVPITRRLGGLDVAAIGGSLVRASAAAAVMAALLEWSVPLVDWTARGMGRAVWLAAIIAAGGAAFALVALLLGGREVTALRRAVGERLGRGRVSGLEGAAVGAR